jgi:hypothetical protein
LDRENEKNDMNDGYTIVCRNNERRNESCEQTDAVKNSTVNHLTQCFESDIIVTSQNVAATSNITDIRGD